MSATDIDPGNVDTWLPLSGLKPGFDANKAGRSTALAGRDLTIAFDDGRPARYDSADHSLTRSHGALFGLDESWEGTTHFTFGAYGRLLGATIYPEPYHPPIQQAAGGEGGP